MITKSSLEKKIINKLDSFKENFESVHSRLSKFEVDNKELKEKLDLLTDRSSVFSVGRTVNKINDVIAELNDIQNRSRNVNLYNLQESPSKW